MYFPTKDYTKLEDMLKIITDGTKWAKFATEMGAIACMVEQKITQAIGIG